jgi:hypothetical protein
MSTPTPITVFPNPVPVFLIHLPENYPRLPITEMNLQPVSYTQGIANVSYVTVLLPLSPKQTALPAQEIYKEGDNESGYTFTYNIQVVNDDTADDVDRLALMSFSFFTHLSGLTPFKVAIGVSLLTPTSAGLGKVVMDSNMDPTDPR